MPTAAIASYLRLFEDDLADFSTLAGDILNFYFSSTDFLIVVLKVQRRKGSSNLGTLVNPSYTKFVMIGQK